MLDTAGKRVRRQRLALAAAEAGAQEHTGVLGDELIDADTGTPRHVLAPLGHRADARPPAVMPLQLENVATTDLGDEVRQPRHVAVDVRGGVEAEREAPIALTDRSEERRVGKA